MARLRFTGTVLAILFVLDHGFTASAQTTCPGTGTCYYVNGTFGNDAWSGTSPICAAPDGPKQTIQSAINLTITGDTVIVADGTYTPTETDATSCVRRYFLHKDEFGAVQLITVGSASGAANCIIDCNPLGYVPADCDGTSAIQCRGFDFDHDNATRDAVIEGFTIRGGYVASGNPAIGAGIRIVQSEPTIRGCVIEQNISSHGGGVGISAKYFQKSPLIEYCTIRKNTASSGAGGGIYSTLGCRPEIVGCTIGGTTSAEKNSAGTFGGGFYSDLGSTFTIKDCLFGFNESGNRGGGIYAELDADEFKSQIVRSTFVGNDSHLVGNPPFIPGGGAIAIVRGVDTLPVTTMTLRLINNRILGNKGQYGAGLAVFGTSTAPPTKRTEIQLVNTEFVGNAAVGSGGAVYLYYHVQAQFDNCTIAHNTATASIGGIFWENVRSISEVIPINNSIFWGNTTPQLGLDQYPLTVTVRYSDVQDGSVGVGNINTAPLFVDADGSDGSYGTSDDDVSLLASSPCIDAGRVFLVPPDILDVDENGNKTEPTPALGTPPQYRVQRCEVDMGAYELPPSAVVTTLRPVQDADGYCFSTAKICVGGSRNGLMCTVLGDCPYGGTACVALAASPCTGLGVACGLYGTCWDLSKNRTLSFSNPNGGLTAIRVNLVDLQHPKPANLPAQAPPNFTTFDTRLNGVCNGGTLVGHHCDADANCPPGVVAGRCSSMVACTAVGETNGCARWVGKPGIFLESQDAGPSGGIYIASRLQCTPFYRDWSTVGEDFLGSTDPIDDTIDVVGAEILPSSVYEINVLPKSLCEGNETTCTDVSCIALSTARSGDTAPNFNPPSTTGQPDALDVTAVVNKLKNVPDALSKVIVQLQPDLPQLNANVNALDIVAVVDAVRGLKYRYSGPCTCPSAVTCGPAAGSVACATSDDCAGLGAGSMCVKTCVGGDNAGDPCINNTHCRYCVGGTKDGWPCDSETFHGCQEVTCPTNATCGNQTNPDGKPGFCRDRCGRCTP